MKKVWLRLRRTADDAAELVPIELRASGVGGGAKKLRASIASLRT